MRVMKLSAGLLCTAIAVSLTACGSAARPAAATSATTATASGARPNIVFVLTDDLSTNLLSHMPQVQALKRDGMSFSNYSVTDSLCCPSRSSTFTGKYPHDTGVFTNLPPDGGFGIFHARGNEQQTFATALQGAGYRTAMMGKYLNGYMPAKAVDGKANYVPPGWSEWDVAGNGYGEYNYDLNVDGQVVHHGHTPLDYLTDVIGSRGQDFIRASAAAGTPFMLELATFAPHGPSTPAPQDVGRFPGLKAPRTASYDKLPTNAPSWLKALPALTAQDKGKLDKQYAKRVRAVQEVDRQIGQLRQTLQQTGQADNTYIVFASDNGFHLGEHGLRAGKQTAFSTDVKVPLVVAGPGVEAGSSSSAMVSNIDLCPTFETMGGVTPPASTDGRSALGLLHGGDDHFRTATLVEHHHSAPNAADPDRPAKGAADPPSYAAMRTATTNYVEYAGGQHEYYDERRDPAELHNTYDQLSAARRAQLHRQLAKLRSCHGQRSCLAAGRPGT